MEASWFSTDAPPPDVVIPHLQPKPNKFEDPACSDNFPVLELYFSDNHGDVCWTSVAKMDWECPAECDETEAKKHRGAPPPYCVNKRQKDVMDVPCRVTSATAKEARAKIVANMDVGGDYHLREQGNFTFRDTEACTESEYPLLSLRFSKDFGDVCRDIPEKKGGTRWRCPQECAYTRHFASPYCETTDQKPCRVQTRSAIQMRDTVGKVASIPPPWHKARTYGRKHDKDPRLVFIHIPKTGGSSVEDKGRAHQVHWGSKYDADRMSMRRRIETPASNIDVCNRAQYLPLVQQNGVCCSWWHVPPRYLARDPRPYFNAPLRFCTVRNPYARLMSEYHYNLMMFKFQDYAGSHNGTAANRVMHGLHKTDTECEKSPEVIAMARKGFSDWIIELYGRWKTKKEINDCHMLPQADYIAPKFMSVQTLVRSNMFESFRLLGGANRSELGCNVVLRQENLTSELTELVSWATENQLLTADTKAADGVGTVSEVNMRHKKFCSQVLDVKQMLTPRAVACATEMVKDDVQLLGYEALPAPDWDVAKEPHAKPLCGCLNTSAWGDKKTCGLHTFGSMPWCYVTATDACRVVGDAKDVRSKKGPWNPCASRRYLP